MMELCINKQETENVVQNDTDAVTVAGAAVTAPKLLDDMEALRIKWEEGVYRTSNLALYDVLARCLAFAGELPTSDAKARNAALEAFYKERGYRYKKDAPLLTRVVRAVFGGVDRRRISTYSLVLRQAQSENVLPNKLTEWIEQRGGVQEIRLARSATFVSPKQRADIAKQRWETQKVLAVVQSDALSLLADAEYAGDNCVLLAEQQSDGTFVIRALLRQDGVVNAAFTALYAQQKPAVDAAEEERVAANEASGLPRAA